MIDEGCCESKKVEKHSSSGFVNYISIEKPENIFFRNRMSKVSDLWLAHPTLLSLSFLEDCWDLSSHSSNLWPRRSLEASATGSDEGPSSC